MPESQRKNNKTFTIAGLMILTAIIAVHCAYPELLECLAMTMILGLLFFCFPIAPFYTIAALFSEQKGSQLDVDKNPVCRFISYLYLIIVCLIYACLVVVSFIS